MTKKSRSPQSLFAKGQKVWIIKERDGFTLSAGKFSGEVWPFGVIPEGSTIEQPFVPKHICVTEYEAREEANAMIKARIKSLRKQITKLEQMKF